MRRCWHRTVRVSILVIFVLGAVVLRAPPRLEAASFVVDNLSDDPSLTACTAAANDCSLRGALSVANANGVADTITFASGLSGTITLGLALPALSAAQPTAIHGPGGGSAAPSVVIDCGGGAFAGFTVTSAGNAIRDLSIINCDDGVFITGEGADNNRVADNWIGLNPSGVVVPNSYDGVHIDNGADSNIIGGTTAADRNVISGNDGGGVGVWGGSTGNLVQGNYIGTDKNGTADLGNSGDGVFINGTGNTIGGTTTAARNVISGNNNHGVEFNGSTSTSNVAQGNYIGTDVTGTADLGNSLSGVFITAWASSNTIGGTTTAARNVISGNDRCGVEIPHVGSTGNLVQGNYIGTDVTGTADLGNTQTGVWISGPGNAIGGISEGADNVIAYNGSDGVRVYGGTATGNSIRANSIQSNGAKGIENINGGNTELPPPVIDNVGSASGHTQPKCYPCTVDVFSDSQDEGRIYHGSTTTNNDATGTWTYSGPVAAPNVTATITDASGNTSEFSPPTPYSPPVGGIAELPDFAGMSAEEGGAPTEGSGWSAGSYAALAGGLAAAVLALTAGAWYARRRWLR